jgi:hypothetical protein
MGFFSQACKGCGLTIRSRHSTRDASRWMTKAVVLFKNGDRVSGEYDGYGRVGNMEDDGGDPIIGGGSNEVWHEACWKAHGKPEFTGPSGGGRDQGYFVGEYDPEEPLTLIEVEALRLQDIRRAKAEHEASKKGMAEYKAQVAAGVTPEMFTKARELKQAFEKVKKLADAAQEIQELAWRHAKDSDDDITAAFPDGLELDEFVSNVCNWLGDLAEKSTAAEKACHPEPKKSKSKKERVEVHS